jgi:hypothetical protein
MSITQKRKMTEKSLAAHRANARKSRGPATPEGKARMRDAKLQHGFYSQDRDTALRALGEKPEDYDAVVKAVKERWAPADDFEELLAAGLAQSMWRWERSHRMQDGHALRQAREMNQSREARIHARLMRLKMTGGSLQSLAQSVAQEYYVTQNKDLELMQSLHDEGEVKEIGAVAVALFCQLLPPGAAPGEPDEEEKQRRLEIQSRNALRRIKEIFGLAGDQPPAPIKTIYNSGPTLDGQPTPPQAATPAAAAVPPVAQRADSDNVPPKPVVAPVETAEARARRLYPKITENEWDKREPLRQLLENLLTRHAQLCQDQCLTLLRESVKGPSPYERAAEIAPVHPNAALMQRMEDSSYRQMCRTTNLLMKLRQERHQSSGNRQKPGNLSDKKGTYGRSTASSSKIKSLKQKGLNAGIEGE